jgi:hypothetical protein
MLASCQKHSHAKVSQSVAQQDVLEIGEALFSYLYMENERIIGLLHRKLIGLSSLIFEVYRQL